VFEVPDGHILKIKPGNPGLFNFRNLFCLVPFLIALVAWSNICCYHDYFENITVVILSQIICSVLVIQCFTDLRS